MGSYAMKSTPPDASLPRLAADFNACGLSGAPDDDCCYGLFIEQLAPVTPREGLRVFAYMDDGDGMVIGCEGVLEKHNLYWQKDREHWRVRPDQSSWVRVRLSEMRAS
jgi:hypothetical protein